MTSTREDTAMTRTSLSVWTFGTSEGAGDAAEWLYQAADRRSRFLPDAAVVWWDEEGPKPQGRRLVVPGGQGALGTAFWELLFGLVFSVPLLGAALGAARGAIPGALSGVGISDTFINRIRDEVTPGTSALFIVSTGEVVDTVRDTLGGQGVEALVSAPLSDDQEAALRAIFTED